MFGLGEYYDHIRGYSEVKLQVSALRGINTSNRKAFIIQNALCKPAL